MQDIGDASAIKTPTTYQNLTQRQTPASKPHSNQKQKITIYTKIKKIKHNTKDSPQSTRDKNNKREEKRPTKPNPKQLTNGNQNICNNNYLKFKWTKCSNQKTETG